MDTMGEEDVDGDDDGIEGMDVVGDDEDVVGARGRRMRLALRRRGGIHLRLPRALQGASKQGISTPKEELDYLPFTTDLLAFGGLVAAGSGIAFPQRPFRGERLIATALATIGGVTFDAGGVVAISPAIYVGAVQVGASQGSAQLSTFGPTAFGVRLAMPVAGQGTRVFIPFIYTGPPIAAAGDQVVVNFSIIGRAVR